MENFDECFDKIKKGYRQNPYKQPLSLSYYGNQARYRERVLSYVDPSVSRYIDLVAGGMGVPYEYCLIAKKPIALNDASYFSHSWARSIFLESEIVMMTDDDLTDLLRVQPVEGYITEFINRPGQVVARGSKIKRKHAMYLDALFQKYNKEPFDKIYVVAAVLKFLIAHWTFRSMGFCGSSGESVPLQEYPDIDLVSKIWRCLAYIRTYNTALESDVKKANQVFWGDASSFVEAANLSGLFKNAHVYMDPAWPWKEGGENPYEFSGRLLPKWAWQTDDVALLRIWGNKDEKRVLDDIQLWVSNALEGGAQKVVVNTQSTNFPDPATSVQPMLEKYFETITDVNTEKSGATQAKTFQEFYFQMSKLK